MVFKGTLEVTFNQDGEDVVLIAPERSVISIPENSWRQYRAREGECEVTLTTRGDQRKSLYWDEEIIAAAEQLGWVLDPDGYIASADVLPLTARKVAKNAHRAYLARIDK